MNDFDVTFVDKHRRRFSVSAESEKEAIERVLRGEGIEHHDDYPEPEIYVKQREG